MSPLACSVRNCSLPLERGERTWSCARGHSFDVARSGYVNLLQPQDRRSRRPGDSAVAVEARARALAAGPGRGVLEGFVGRAAALAFADAGTVVDLGCGSGDVLGGLSRRRAIDAVGIDLSSAAIDRAAKNFPDLTWVVANADRRLPLLDAGVSLVLSLHARRNPAECARVLGADGLLLMAIPAEDDLAELRAAVQGSAVSRDRADALLTAHDPYFRLLDRSTVRDVVDATPAQLIDLLAGTYRGARRQQVARAEHLKPMKVTFASEFLLFTKHC